MGWLLLSNRHTSTCPVPLGFPAGQKEWLLSLGHCSTGLGLASALSSGLWSMAVGLQLPPVPAGALPGQVHSPLICLTLSLPHPAGAPLHASAGLIGFSCTWEVGVACACVCLHLSSRRVLRQAWYSLPWTTPPPQKQRVPRF